MDVSKALEVYVLAVVGDGLVSQIPALLVSTATGVIVTRSASENSFGQEVSKQMLARPSVLFVLGGMLFLMALIPACRNCRFSRWLYSCRLPRISR